ncbi:MAG: hypothetical protein Q9M17_03345 [Mariprofundus sp.]|nr:hypothetical protein [Mariprofundus sp.]
MVNARIKSILMSIGLVLLASCSSNPAWMKPTGKAASVPDNSVAFSTYAEESRENIQSVLDDLRFQNGAATSPYLGGYSSKEIAKMRGPFQVPAEDKNMCWDSALGGGKGFLLIHGLTDSPYLMKNISDSLHKAYPCALIRAVLLPGHGTASGDTLDMTYKDWVRITAYGVHSFQKMDKIKELYLAGFSTGTTLALNYMKEGSNTEKIKGLVLLSTAVKSKSKFAFLSPYLREVMDWVDKKGERDGARYESFSLNAGAEFYELTKNLTSSIYTLDVPVLMAVSADDETIDPYAARDFFCDRMVSERTLIWYESRYTEKQSLPSASCEKDIVTRQMKHLDQNYNGTSYRFTNFAHTGISMEPGDKHYGVNGKYRSCKYYEGKEDGSFKKCQNDSQHSFFGETNTRYLTDQGKPGYRYLRRGTFNPDYEKLEQAMICFTTEGCDLKRVLTVDE